MHKNILFLFVGQLFLVSAALCRACYLTDLLLKLSNFARS